MKKTITDPALPPPPLTDLSRPWGIIRFAHRDGTEHTFYSVINEMSGHRLAAFDSDPPSVAESQSVIPTYRDDAKVFANIRMKAKQVVAFSGTAHFQ